MEQLRAIWCWLNPSEWSRRTSFNLRGQPLLWQLGFSTYKWSPVATAALRRRSNPMPITVPNYDRKTDRLQFGILIDITSES